MPHPPWTRNSGSSTRFGSLDLRVRNSCRHVCEETPLRFLTEGIWRELRIWHPLSKTTLPEGLLKLLPRSLPQHRISWGFAAKDMLPKSVEPTEIMVSDVFAGLTKFGGNFIEGVALKEIKSQGLPLVLRKRAEQFLQTGPSEHPVGRNFVLPDAVLSRQLI